MEYINRTVTYGDCTRTFRWPKKDSGLYKDLVTLSDLDEHVLPAVPKLRTVVQAGCAMGVWPWVLSKHFEFVYTFEAHPINAYCSAQNIGDLANVHLLHAALGETHGMINVGYENPDNHGAFRVVGPGRIPMLRLDDFEFENVDLLTLDIEGAELAAIRGARDLISKWRPIVVLEDKDVCARHFGYRAGDIEKILQADFGYRSEVKRFHGGRDVIIYP